MPKITLYDRFTIQKHWMQAYGQPEQELEFQYEIEVPDIDSVKYTHSHVRTGLFSDTVTTYSAIKYKGVVFKLSYDVGLGKWVAELNTFLPQGSVYTDWAQILKEKLSGWKVVDSYAKA